jgi:hypothetical protein
VRPDSTGRYARWGITFLLPKGAPAQHAGGGQRGSRRAAPELRQGWRSPESLRGVPEAHKLPLNEVCVNRVRGRRDELLPGRTIAFGSTRPFVRYGRGSSWKTCHSSARPDRERFREGYLKAGLPL